MNFKGKALAPVLIILVILLLGLAVTSLFFLRKENDARVDAEKKLDQTEQMLETFEARLSDSQKIVLQLNEKLTASQKETDDLANQLNLARVNADVAIEEKENLRLELESLKGSEGQLVERLDGAQKELDAVKSELNTLNEEKTSLEKKIKDLQASTGVDLDKIVVNYPEAKEGQVLVVNRDNDFIIVNLGQKDNISVGQPLYIYQNNKFLGVVKIEKIQQAMSVAALLDSNIKTAIKEGDIVKFKK